MVHTVLKHIGGIEQYGVFSLCLFCTIFFGVLLWTFAQKKSHLEYMSRVALDPEQDRSQNRKDGHE